MKAILVLLALVLVLVVAGWLTFGRTDGKPAVILETGQIQQDTEEATEKGKELLRKDDSSPTDAGAEAPTPSNEPGPGDVRSAAPPDQPQ
jgi:hypothetical protein